MAFCKNCGLPVGNKSNFCVHCGTKITTPQMPRKGRGLGIASMIVGILSGVIALELLVLSFVAHAVPSLAKGAHVFLIFIPIYAVLPVLSIIFSTKARAQGYSGALGKVGLKLGTASLIALAIGTLSFALVLCL